MAKLSKILAVLAVAVKLGAAVTAALSGHESDRTSHESSYGARDDSSNYGYGGWYGWDHRGVDRGRGHDRRR
jgi:hypothetical protein